MDSFKDKDEASQVKREAKRASLMKVVWVPEAWRSANQINSQAGEVWGGGGKDRDVSWHGQDYSSPWGQLRWEPWAARPSKESQHGRILGRALLCLLLVSAHGREQRREVSSDKGTNPTTGPHPKDFIQLQVPPWRLTCYLRVRGWSFNIWGGRYKNQTLTPAECFQAVSLEITGGWESEQFREKNKTFRLSWLSVEVWLFNFAKWMTMGSPLTSESTSLPTCPNEGALDDYPEWLPLSSMVRTF